MHGQPTEVLVELRQRHLWRNGGEGIGRIARYAAVDELAEGVEVVLLAGLAACAGGLTEKGLWRQKIERARQLGGCDREGGEQPKIGQFGDTIDEEDVVWLDVAMSEARKVQGGDGLQDGAQRRDDLILKQGAFFQAHRQRVGAVVVLTWHGVGRLHRVVEGVVIFADMEDLQDSWRVFQHSAVVGDAFEFPFPTGANCHLGDDLQRDLLACGLLAVEDFAEGAAPASLQNGQSI